MLKLNVVDQETIKDSNKKKILQLLQIKREMTKQDIAREINLSIPTVINNIKELGEEGLVEEAGVADSTGGRKPVIIRFLPDSRYSFGVDFNDEGVRIILTNIDSEIKEDVYLNRSESMSFDEIISGIMDTIKSILQEKDIDPGKVLGVGFSLPGTVNEEKKLLELAPNLGIRNLSFKEFEERLGIPLYIENEAKAAAFAELTLGIAKQMRNLVYISITKGIGTGIVIQDNIYKGKNKRAGEFGHMIVKAGGRQCRCGRHGCWETYASDKALLESYNETAHKNINSLDEFFKLLKRGDVLAQEVWDEYLTYLAIGIQNIILVIDPHYIVLGGRIAQYEEILIDKLKEKVFITNSFYNRDDIRIIVSKLKENSSILGASLLPIQKLFHINKKII